MRKRRPPAPPPGPTPTREASDRNPRPVEEQIDFALLALLARVLKHPGLVLPEDPVNAQDLHPIDHPRSRAKNPIRASSPPSITGFRRPACHPLWAGEGNVPTPEAFCRAGNRKPAQGRDLLHLAARHSGIARGLARYHNRHFGREFSPREFLRHQRRHAGDPDDHPDDRGDGDEIILPTPAWPNYAGPLRIQGSVPVKCRWISQTAAGFSISTDCSLRSRRAPRPFRSTRRPIRWAGRRARDELIAVRDECRKRGIWIFGDEVYSRFYYGPGAATRAPSFLDICDNEERLLLANTFSKNWAMTGWRVGWLQAPKELAAADRAYHPVQYQRHAGVPAARLCRGARSRRGLHRTPGCQGARQSRPRLRPSSARFREFASKSRRAPSTCSSPSTA